jgi:AAA-like domain/TIR domain
MTGRRIFISYKRHTELDHPLAERLLARLREHGHTVFLDQTMMVGEDWVKRIQAEVAVADFLVLLLSEQSVQSAMVVEEVRMAVEQRRRSGSQPAILPVRVGFEGALPYDLGAWLNAINYALWRSPADDDHLLAALLRAITGQSALPAPVLRGAGLAADVPLPSAHPWAALVAQHDGRLEAPEGTISPASPFYVSRLADQEAEEEQQRSGYTLTIQAPRQMGKSSLLGRVMLRAQRAGKRVAFVDFQGFGVAQSANPEALYSQFCYSIDAFLKLDVNTAAYWAAQPVHMSMLQKTTNFMEECVLPRCGAGGLLLALDEADTLLDVPTRSDFFGMLRSWHNKRALQPVWQSFALAQVISTEPHMLIENLTQSPFNVGANLRLKDFTLMEVEQLHVQHGSPLRADELAQLHRLLSGHPYLTRKALYVLSKRRYTLAELLKEADSDSGPFGDHLRTLVVRLHTRPGLVSAVRSVLGAGARGGARPSGWRAIWQRFWPVGRASAPLAPMAGCAEAVQRHRLIAGGVLKEVEGQLMVRCPLYGAYLARVL